MLLMITSKLDLDRGDMLDVDSIYRREIYKG